MKRKYIIIGGVVLVAAVGGYVYYKKRKGESLMPGTDEKQADNGIVPPRTLDTNVKTEPTINYAALQAGIDKALTRPILPVTVITPTAAQVSEMAKNAPILTTQPAVARPVYTAPVKTPVPMPQPVARPVYTAPQPVVRPVYTAPVKPPAVVTQPVNTSNRIGTPQISSRYNSRDLQMFGLDGRIVRA